MANAIFEARINGKWVVYRRIRDISGDDFDKAIRNQIKPKTRVVFMGEPEPIDRNQRVLQIRHRTSLPLMEILRALKLNSWNVEKAMKFLISDGHKRMPKL